MVLDGKTHRVLTHFESELGVPREELIARAIALYLFLLYSPGGTVVANGMALRLR